MSQSCLRGVNLAGWLVLESWVTPRLFQATGALDESGLLEALGAEDFAELVEQHRSSFIVEDDFATMAKLGFNAVRLPIPWHVFGPFGPLPGLHKGSLNYVDLAFEWAAKYDLKLLLDMALVPGASFVNDGLLMHWDIREPYRDAVLSVIAALAKRYADNPQLLGIEPLDSPAVMRRRGVKIEEGIPLRSLRKFYQDAYEIIRHCAGEKPVVVLSDPERSGVWRSFGRRRQGVWLDCHSYYHGLPFDAAGPSGVPCLLERVKDSIRRAESHKLPVMVGEWSAALPAADASITPEGRRALERIFMTGQLGAYEDCAAWFFQTWKTEPRMSAWDARSIFSSFEKDVLL